MDRVRLPTLVLLALLLTVAAAALAAGASARAEDTFEGTVDASGQAGTLDVSVTRPGNLTAPSWAERVLVHVAWEQAPPADIELELREDPCQGRCPAPALGEDTGEQQAQLAVPVPDDGRIHWRVSATNGTAVQEPFVGTATWHTTVHDEPAPRSAARAAASPTPASDEARLPAAAWMGLAGSLASLALLARPRWRRWLAGVAIALYHRVRDHELLENETRAGIHALAREEPGIHYEELRRRLDVSRGTLEHHLGRLLEAGLLVEERANGYRCLFLAGHLDETTRQALASVRSGSARRIVAVLAEHGGLGVRELARAIDRSPSTVCHHLDSLRDAGIVQGVQRGRELALSLTSRGERLSRHLAR